jgi:hypothetical protein
MAAAPPRPSRATNPRRPRTLTIVELVEFARGAGFRDDRPSVEWGTSRPYHRYKGVKASSELAVAVAIALAESGGRTAARGPRGSRGYPIGPWQIYPGNDTLLDPAANARAAFAKYTSNGRHFGKGSASTCLWSVFCSGAYRAHLGRAERAVKATQGFERSGILAPGRTAEELIVDPIAGLFTKYVLPALKISAGGLFLLAALAGTFAVMALAKDPGQAASGAAGGALAIAKIRTPARAAAVAERGKVRARNRQELARARVYEEGGRVRITSRSTGRARIAEEAEQEAERREGSRRERRPNPSLRVIEGVGPGAKGRRRTA